MTKGVTSSPYPARTWGKDAARDFDEKAVLERKRRGIISGCLSHLAIRIFQITSLASLDGLDGNLGQRSVPYAPSQIAGGSSLVVTEQGISIGD